MSIEAIQYLRTVINQHHGINVSRLELDTCNERLNLLESIIQQTADDWNGLTVKETQEIERQFQSKPFDMLDAFELKLQEKNP